MGIGRIPKSSGEAISALALAEDAGAVPSRSFAARASLEPLVGPLRWPHSDGMGEAGAQDRIVQYFGVCVGLGSDNERTERIPCACAPGHCGPEQFLRMKRRPGVGALCPSAEVGTGYPFPLLCSFVEQDLG